MSKFTNKSVSNINQNTPKFTLEQCEWLARAFPECLNPTATSEELYINLGERRVVQRIKSLYLDSKRSNSA